MELDDLRGKWQAQTASDTADAHDAAGLALLLARNSANPVGRMRRNAWMEIGMVVLIFAGCIAAAIVSNDAYYLTMAAWMAIMCLLSGLYFRYKLALLYSLSDASGALLDIVQQRLTSLRGLVALYFRATMWSLPISLGIGLLFIGGRIAQKLEGQKLLLSMSILLLVFAFTGLCAYFLTRRFTHWYLQRLYGQHLDQLEAALRELRD
ncbi:hypothetical protein [Hymenobacter actinosclerus]|nr:hypothetical protein [Hymenobacter actinosclerus]